MIGKLYLYSRYRKDKRRLRDIEAEAAQMNEICNNCGHPRFRHADDARASCPTY